MAPETAVYWSSLYCLYHLLPPQRPLHDALRVRGHQFQLPNCIYKFHKQSFTKIIFFLDWFFPIFPYCVLMLIVILY